MCVCYVSVFLALAILSFIRVGCFMAHTLYTHPMLRVVDGIQVTSHQNNFTQTSERINE